MLKSKITRYLAAAAVAALMTGTSIAEAAGVLTIGRREDGTTFDPIATAQNIDFWVFANVYDVLVRVDKTGTKLEPGLAESWEVSEDGATYTFKMRDAKFSDGSQITSEDAKFSLERIRDDEGSLWSDSYQIIENMETPDPPDSRCHALWSLRAVSCVARHARRIDHLQGRYEGNGCRSLCRTAYRFGGFLGCGLATW